MGGLTKCRGARRWIGTIPIAVGDALVGGIRLLEVVALGMEHPIAVIGQETVCSRHVGRHLNAARTGPPNEAEPPQVPQSRAVRVRLMTTPSVGQDGDQ